MSEVELMDKSPGVIEEAVAWRRQLHAHPELAYNERRTSNFVAEQLTHFGLKVHRGLAGTGVVGTLTRGTSRRTIAIRADMDALPIQEQSGVSHASRVPGVMHACGHDGHVAIALAAARVCADMPNLDGTVHFVFQPAEENEGGGRRMVDDGLFRLFPCEAIYALHNWPALPLGTCTVLDGPMMAALGIFEISISGRGCHGAMPHQGADSVLAGCQIVSALQSIVSRNVDPQQAAVISATQIHGGDTWNVIPQNCVIRGTTRWFDEDVGSLLERRIEEVSRSIATGLGCEATVRCERRFPATVNDATAASFVRGVINAASADLTLVEARPSMGSEDFAFMLQAVPGCYVWLGGGRSKDDPGLHSPRYDFNDELISRGVALWTAVVAKSLAPA